MTTVYDLKNDKIETHPRAWDRLLLLYNKLFEQRKRAQELNFGENCVK